MIIIRPLFSKSSVFKTFPVHTKTKSQVIKFLFEKLGFGNGLVWTVSLTEEVRLRFLIFRRSMDAGLTL